MEPWTFRRYRRPALAVDGIDIDPEGRAVALCSGQRRYWLAVDDPDGAARLARDLSDLRQAGAPLWEALRTGEADTGWRDLATFLDARSLIREAREDAALRLAAETRQVRDAIRGTLNAILDGLAEDGRAALWANAMIALEALRDGPYPSAAGPDPFDPDAQPNFFLGLLSLEFAYLRTASPPTLAAAEAMLTELAAAPGGGSGLEAALGEASGVYDPRDLASHLWLVGQALLMSTTETAARLPAPPPGAPPLHCGLEVMRQAELLARDVLAAWGPNAYAEAMDAVRDPTAPLVVGAAVEEFHVTRRLVEVIAPLLSRRLAPPLRAMMFRYFAEEIGHEALESASCQALGVSPAALDQAVPLPLNFAFVDVLTLLASEDPLAAFASLMVIEGLFGETPRAGSPLEADAHDALNAALHHNSIARVAFEQVGAVSPARQVAIRRKLLFMLELSHRAWAGVAAFYGAQPRLRLLGPFGQPLAPDAGAQAAAQSPSRPERSDQTG